MIPFEVISRVPAYFYYLSINGCGWIYCLKGYYEELDYSLCSTFGTDHRFREIREDGGSTFRPCGKKEGELYAIGPHSSCICIWLKERNDEAAMKIFSKVYKKRINNLKKEIQKLEFKQQRMCVIRKYRNEEYIQEILNTIIEKLGGYD